MITSTQSVSGEVSEYFLGVQGSSKYYDQVHALVLHDVSLWISKRTTLKNWVWLGDEAIVRKM